MKSFSPNPPETSLNLADEVGGAPLRAAHGSHTAHFYSNDSLLVADIVQCLGATLDAGGAAVVIATPAHRAAFEEQLLARGVDLVGLAQRGRWLSLDAAEALGAFMVEGWPDANGFAAHIGGVVDRLASAVHAASENAHPIAAYGEMVSVLWEEGKAEASLRVEELWNELAQTRCFHLSCGWPLHFFARDTDGISIRRICSAHNHVVPGQGYDAMSEDERRRSTVVLQQKAQALEEETRQVQKTQQTLALREAELRDFLENAVVGMHWLASDGTILWSNRSELEMLGYQPQEYVGRNFADFIEKPAVAADLLRRLRACENVRGYELRLRSSDGSWRWVRLDASPWLQDGGYLHARCFVLDIGEKKRADEVQIKLAAIVESSDDAIVSKDLNGVITSWNAAAERILGYTAEEMIGKPVTTIIPLDLQRDETEILRRIQAGESIEHFETVRVTKSGQRIDVSLTISPVRDPHGTIIGAAKILRDVTRQKKLEAALRSTEHLAAVGRLAATVAHEINNPLEAVTNLIYLARQDTSLPESARVCLVMADEELKRVSHIARQTLGFYRDTSTPVWIDVPTAIDEMLAIYHRRLGYRQIGLRKEITAGLRVYALPGEFRQIISNLIVNAIDASSPGTTIDVRAWEASHPVTGARGIQLAVADQGVGIPESIRRQIFTPFFTTKKDVGTGLGLWIVKSMLVEAGGFIRCRSRVSIPEGAGSGTVMMVFLPSESGKASRNQEAAA